MKHHANSDMPQNDGPSDSSGDDRWIRDVCAAVTGSVLSAIPVFLIAALAPQIRTSLHFSVSTLGIIIALYYLSAALGSVPLSRLVERIGAARTMRAGSAITAMLLLLMALLAHGIVSLTGLLVLAGLASSAIQPATNLFLIRRIAGAHRGRAFGFKQAAVPLAVVISGLAVPTLALNFGWRWTIGIIAIIAFIASMRMPRGRMSLSATRARPAVPAIAQRDRNYLVILTSGFTLGIVAASSLSTFAVTALAASGISYATAGMLASLGGLVAATTRATVGMQADHRVRAPFRVIAIMLGLGAVAYAILALATTLVLGPLLLVALLCAFSAGWGWNGLFSFAVATQFPTQAARATAIASIGGRSGGVLGPFIFGVVATHGSYAWAWFVAALAAASGACIIMLAQRYGPSDKTASIAS